ncbi:hypothetical protein BC829DRAFT_150393 [Chytridium lagenaria]|nr:hypothetical protein BC829DRAFT_150393 [Chytridium lagenaria]
MYAYFYVSFYFSTNLYPLLKYAVTFVNRKTFAFASPPVPQNRSEEIVTKYYTVNLSMGNNLLWDVTGYVLILRNPSNTIFYLTLAATCLYNTNPGKYAGAG